MRFSEVWPCNFQGEGEERGGGRDNGKSERALKRERKAEKDGGGGGEGRGWPGAKAETAE